MADEPKQLANKIVRQIVDHIFTDDYMTDVNDYMAIRLAFQKLGGSWEKIVNGDQAMADILLKVVMAWGSLPGRRKKSEEAV